jgi:hypothetical protein
MQRHIECPLTPCSSSRRIAGAVFLARTNRRRRRWRPTPSWAAQSGRQRPGPARPLRRSRRPIGCGQQPRSPGPSARHVAPDADGIGVERRIRAGHWKLFTLATGQGVYRASAITAHYSSALMKHTTPSELVTARHPDSEKSPLASISARSASTQCLQLSFRSIPKASPMAASRSCSGDIAEPATIR